MSSFAFKYSLAEWEPGITANSPKGQVLILTECSSLWWNAARGAVIQLLSFKDTNQMRIPTTTLTVVLLPINYVLKHVCWAPVSVITNIISPLHRYHRTFGEGTQCEWGQFWGRRRFEDDGDHFLCVGGHRCNLHRAAGAEEEEEGAEAQEAPRWDERDHLTWRILASILSCSTNKMMFSLFVSQMQKVWLRCSWGKNVQQLHCSAIIKTHISVCTQCCHLRRIHYNRSFW